MLDKRLERCFSIGGIRPRRQDTGIEDRIPYR